MDILEQFPVELRENILMKLGVEDLLNCSRVSTIWRSRVNCNLIWRRHCTRKLFTVPVMEKYKAAVFYKYDYKPERTNLEPMCLWRLVYAVNMALMKRWHDGKWRRTVFKKTTQAYCLDCDERSLASGHEDGSVFVWSIELLKLVDDGKTYKLNTTQCLLKGTPVTTVRICNDYILVLQKQLLQTYKLSADNDLQLVGVCSYELGESNMNLMKQASFQGDNFDHWYKECLRNYDVYPLRRLKFLATRNVCFAGVGGSDSVDIWELEGKPKACLAGFSHLRNILEHNGDLFIISGDNPTVVSRYCWSKNEVDKVIMVCGFKRIELGEEYILALPHPSDTKMTMMWVWDRCYRLVRTRVLTSSIVTAVSTSLIIYSENSLVTVWNPVTDTVLKTFSVGASVGFMRHAHSSLIVLFVNASLDVWDFLTGKRLSRLYSRLEWSGDFRDLLWLNPTAVIAGGVRSNIQLLRYLYFI